MEKGRDDYRGYSLWILTGIENQYSLEPGFDALLHAKFWHYCSRSLDRAVYRIATKFQIRMKNALIAGGDKNKNNISTLCQITLK
jgi:hypothetical protein